ncbi:hypothetical protein B0A49_06589 [Cryomyces minteri]|uniref:Uncharacterized protein n=1 Tax=Cryomyces minteri TaxID=331657 RepID=A0A4U0WPD1_9PEZI|nr:hypothetical protein B0A49_06589 [Cryomyces minteri]
MEEGDVSEPVVAQKWREEPEAYDVIRIPDCGSNDSSTTSTKQRAKRKDGEIATTFHRCPSDSALARVHKEKRKMRNQKRSIAISQVHSDASLVEVKEAPEAPHIISLPLRPLSPQRQASFSAPGPPQGWSTLFHTELRLLSPIAEPTALSSHSSSPIRWRSPPPALHDPSTMDSSSAFVAEGPTPDALMTNSPPVSLSSLNNADEDDGTGINGIGYRPTPAVAYARSQRRKMQVHEWKVREAREARGRRMERRKGHGGFEDREDERQERKKRIVRFA